MILPPYSYVSKQKVLEELVIKDTDEIPKISNDDVKN